MFNSSPDEPRSFQKMSHNRSGGKSRGGGYGGFSGFSGFQMPKRSSTAHSMHAVPPPSTITDSGRSSSSGGTGPNATVSRQGYSTLNAISQNAITVNWGSNARKRSKTEDELVKFYIFCTLNYILLSIFVISSKIKNNTTSSFVSKCIY